MNDEQNMRANDLDSRIENNHLQMMKAALPFMNAPQQRFISYFVKFNELQRTINLFEDEEVATMGICSTDNRQSPDSPIEMLNTIKPFANKNEQDLIDLIVNTFQGFKIAGAYQDFVPTSSVPVQAQNQNQNQTQSEGENKTQNNKRQNNPLGRMSFDQLKNFIPPEQQSRFDTMQLMMSAMQQMN
jgi:hypothetical protein